MGKLVFLLITLLLIFNLSACMSSGDSEITSESSEKENVENVVLRMNVSSIVNLTRAEDVRYYLVYTKLTGERITDSNRSKMISYAPIESDEVEVQLDKDSVYVIGIAEKNEFGWYQMIGFIGEPHYGILCVPIGDSPASVVDLGRISKYEENGEVVLKPEITPEEFLNAVGLSEELVREIGSVDVTFKNLLNPDINRNGVLDYEEGMNWGMDMFYKFSPPGEGTSPELEEVLYSFNISREAAVKLYGEEFAINAYLGNRVSDGVHATLTLLDEGGEEFLGNPYVHVEYELDYRYMLWRKEVTNGDYVLTVEGSDTGKEYRLYFDDMRFYYPDNGFDGLIYVLVNDTVYSDGKVKNIAWKYVKFKENGEKEAVDPDLMCLLSGNNIPFFVYYEPLYLPQPDIVNVCESHEEPLSLEDKSYYLLKDGIITGMGNLGLAGEVTVKYQYYHNFLKYPLGFPYDSRQVEISKDTIVGTWYNLYHNFENYRSYENGGSFQIPESVWARVVFKEDGTFLAKWFDFHFGRDYDDYWNDGNKSPDSMLGTYSIDTENERIVLNVDGDTYYMYLKLYENGVMEAVITPQEDYIPRFSEEEEGYVVYSRFSGQLGD